MKHLAYFVFIILLVSAVWSCARVQYVPVPSTSYMKDSVNLIDSLVIRYDTRITDSVRIKDSTVIVQDAEGNVVREKYFRETERYRSLENEYNELKRKYEELKAEKGDSVRVPYPVEKKLSRWQQLRMDAGGIAIAGVIITVLIVFGRLVYKLRK